MGVPEKDSLAELSLPPGFRFYPTDEELLVQYLCRKVAGHHFSLKVIAEIDLYKFDPWVLPSKAIFGEREWYFFSPRERKYPNGSRPNRVAGTGYWKATGTDKIITTEGRKVGIKKALVFYVGKAPKGTKTNWIMHEYRLIESSRRTGSSKLDDWVLCRIYKKNSSSQKPETSLSSVDHSNASTSSSSSHLEDVLESLPEIDDRIFSLPRVNSLRTLQQEQKPGNFQSLNSGNFDWASLGGINFSPEYPPFSQNQSQGQGFVSYDNNGVYASSVPAIGELKTSPIKLWKSFEEEVQSGQKTQRTTDMAVVYQNSNEFLNQNSNGFLNRNPQNSVDPYGFRFQNQFNAFGLRQ